MTREEVEAKSRDLMAPVTPVPHANATLRALLDPRRHKGRQNARPLAARTLTLALSRRKGFFWRNRNPHRAYRAQ